MKFKNIVILCAVISGLTACGSDGTEFSTATSDVIASEEVENLNDLYQTEQEDIHYKNVVAGDKASCDQAVLLNRSKYGITSGVSSCSIGGGCALVGGAPTALNPSANPSLYGACLGPISLEQIEQAYK